jgi:hypothetical protein
MAVLLEIRGLLFSWVSSLQHPSLQVWRGYTPSVFPHVAVPSFVE